MSARWASIVVSAVLVYGVALSSLAQESRPLTAVPPREGDFVAHDFKFADGASLPEIRIHYTTIGTPQRDANGHVNNAVVVLHGTNRKGGVFLVPSFAGVVLLPITRETRGHYTFFQAAAWQKYLGELLQKMSR